jgi:hypothetical protein
MHGILATFLLCLSKPAQMILYASGSLSRSDSAP